METIYLSLTRTDENMSCKKKYEEREGEPTLTDLLTVILTRNSKKLSIPASGYPTSKATTTADEHNEKSEVKQTEGKKGKRATNDIDNSVRNSLVSPRDFEAGLLYLPWRRIRQYFRTSYVIRN